MRESDIDLLRGALKNLQGFCADEGRAGGCLDCRLYMFFAPNEECPKTILETVLNRPEQTFDDCGHVKTGKTIFDSEITYCEINGCITRCDCEDCEDFIPKNEENK